MCDEDASNEDARSVDDHCCRHPALAVSSRHRKRAGDWRNRQMARERRPSKAGERRREVSRQRRRRESGRRYYYYWMADSNAGVGTRYG